MLITCRLPPTEFLCVLTLNHLVCASATQVRQLDKSHFGGRLLRLPCWGGVQRRGVHPSRVRAWQLNGGRARCVHALRGGVVPTLCWASRLYRCRRGVLHCFHLPTLTMSKHSNSKYSKHSKWATTLLPRTSPTMLTMLTSAYRTYCIYYAYSCLLMLTTHAY